MVDNVGMNLLNRMKRLNIFKKPNLLDDNDHEVYSKDPHLKYFRSCQKDMALALPILEKIL